MTENVIRIMLRWLQRQDRIGDRLDEIHRELNRFRRQVMATLAEFQAALTKIDAETTRIGLKIQELVDKLAAGGMSASEEQNALDQLKAAGVKLEGIGKDVTNPVPEPLPPVE